MTIRQSIQEVVILYALLPGKGIHHKSQPTMKFALFSALAFLSFVCLVSAIPQITFVSPTLNDQETTISNWVYINQTSSEDLNQSLLEWGNSNGFTNVSMTNSSMTNWYANMTNLPDGTYNYTIFAQNTTGNWNRY